MAGLPVRQRARSRWRCGRCGSTSAGPGSSTCQRTGRSCWPPTHVSYPDFVLHRARGRSRRGRYVRFLTRHDVWDVPVVPWFMDRMGHIPVNRQAPVHTYLRARRELLAAGEAVVRLPRGGDQLLLHGPAADARRRLPGPGHRRSRRPGGRLGHPAAVLRRRPGAATRPDPGPAHRPRLRRPVVRRTGGGPHRNGPTTSGMPSPGCSRACSSCRTTGPGPARSRPGTRPTSAATPPPGSAPVASTWCRSTR